MRPTHNARVGRSIAHAAQASESVYQASLRTPTWTAAELAAYAAGVFRRGGGKPGNWCADQRWVDACKEVLRLCAEYDIDPKDWVHGALKLHIVIAGQKSWRVHPGHLVGEGALDLARARIHAFGRADESDPEVVALLDAERSFSDLFLGVPLAKGIEQARSAIDVAAEIQAERPAWNLASADPWPHVRWAALNSTLYDGDSTWPDLIPALHEGWRWVDARRHVFHHVAEIKRQAPDREQPDNDSLDHLGELV